MTIGSRVLNGTERIGNRLPDPVFLFLWLIGGLVVLSLVGSGLGWSALNPVTGETLAARSLGVTYSVVLTATCIHALGNASPSLYWYPKQLYIIHLC